MALSLQTSIFQSMNNPGFSSYDNQLYKASLDIDGGASDWICTKMGQTTSTVSHQES